MNQTCALSNFNLVKFLRSPNAANHLPPSPTLLYSFDSGIDYHDGRHHSISITSTEPAT